MKSIFVSGYKNFELGIFKRDAQEVGFIKEALRRRLIGLVEDGLEWVIISGQMGVELWAAEVVTELKAEEYALKLAILTPFLNQESNWNDANKLWYNEVVAKADYMAAVTKREYENPSQFQLKDQFVLDNTDGTLLVYDTEREGAPKFFYEKAKHYAENADYPILLVDFYELQEVVESLNNDF
ncbi:DUF1273 domain-containing protein [Listeria booriae]|uniref:DUF1273 domain-containing protein n=1 Tax=Listeria booriae TaxID=1552123 RepID=UPI00162523C9|nr:DUF1273 domain-containing protein [Listeria booriae]MBC1984652.1 DUF1273 domain-containing protein [Listeria booriae]MBC2046898.1 DUF1273 domain-containing protein [Listeria booriae]MBC2263376.1 DUF1273 domain-containing protein [Listeria booriae]